MNYEHQEFPKWVYYRDGRAVIVADPIEEQALAHGWAETPAAFLDAVEQPRGEFGVAVAEPVPANEHGQPEDARDRAGEQPEPHEQEQQPHKQASQHARKASKKK